LFGWGGPAHAAGHPHLDAAIAPRRLGGARQEQLADTAPQPGLHGVAARRLTGTGACGQPHPIPVRHDGDRPDLHRDDRD